mgnify:CR=1 FL=1
MRIVISFVSNPSGKFDFSIVQDSMVFYKKEYMASGRDETTGHTQAQLFKAYCKFLQEKVNKELAKNPNFRWKSFQEFKKFAGAKSQNEFFENELDYFD